MPQRAKEIKHLKGEEVVDESDNDEDITEAKPVVKKQQLKAEATEKMKGDADSSSDENEESDDEIAAPSQAEKKAANAKLKKDLEKEQKELAKVLMTNKQRKLYQKAADEQKVKKEQVQKLKIKRK